MEQPLFKDNVAEFDALLAALNKPVEKRISSYHLGGTAHHDIVMPEGMPAFTKGNVYGGMMQGFAQAYGDDITALPTGKTTEMAFGTIETYAGISFEFRHGASTDFPRASLLMGKKCITPSGQRQKHISVICKYLHLLPLMLKLQK